jgi:hypothetical protein
MRSLVVVLALAACGGTTPPAADGPAFTPGVAYALHGLAPSCTLSRTPAQEVRTCKGRNGKIDVTIVGGHVHTIAIALRPMVLAEVKAQLGPALLPLLQPPGVDALIAAIAPLQLGDHGALTTAGARITIDAGGTSRIAPAYALSLTW